MSAAMLEARTTGQGLYRARQAGCLIAQLNLGDNLICCSNPRTLLARMTT